MVGGVISHYRIVEELGSGGMGTVDKAEDARLKRRVAFEFLATDQFRDEEIKARFLHEVQAAALDHPNICWVYEIEEAGDRRFIVLPFLDGESVFSRSKGTPCLRLRAPGNHSVVPPCALGISSIEIMPSEKNEVCSLRV